jgi:hypothetical protein
MKSVAVLSVVRSFEALEIPLRLTDSDRARQPATMLRNTSPQPVVSLWGFEPDIAAVDVEALSRPK